MVDESLIEHTARNKSQMPMDMKFKFWIFEVLSVEHEIMVQLASYKKTTASLIVKKKFYSMVNDLQKYIDWKYGVALVSKTFGY